MYISPTLVCWFSNVCTTCPTFFAGGTFVRHFPVLHFPPPEISLSFISCPANSAPPVRGGGVRGPQLRGPKPEAWRAESMGGVSHQLGAWGSAVSSPGEVWGKAQAAKSFDTFCVLRWPLLPWKIACALCKCIISLIFVTHVIAIIARGPKELGGLGSLNRLCAWTPGVYATD